ncbi:hypothetical protein D3C73_1155210 [compost metagenome]
MQAWSIIFCVDFRYFRFIHFKRIICFATYCKRPQAARISWNVGTVYTDDGENLFYILIHFLNEISLEPRVIGLCNKNAVFFERFINPLIESAFKQRGRRANRLGRVYHNNIVFIFALNNMHISIINLDVNPGVVQLTSDFGQVFLGVLNNFTINID